jgi:hypothetical protein
LLAAAIAHDEAPVTLQSMKVLRWANPFLEAREKRGDESEDPLKCRCYGANAGRVPVGSNIEALFFVEPSLFPGAAAQEDCSDPASV